MSALLLIWIGLAALGGLWLFSAGAHAARGIERGMRQVSRTGQVAGLALVLGLVVAVVQWVVLTHIANPSLITLVLVLGVPAVLAGTTVARLVALDTTIRAGSRRSPSRGVWR
jgi:hypothetical protein